MDAFNSLWVGMRRRFFPVYLVSLASLTFGLTASAASTGPRRTGAAAVTNLRIASLRVAFQSDDLATTTGDGRFDLGSSSDYHLDRPPHDRTYFQHQLLALTNYYQRVSRGRLILQSDVYPLEASSVYLLPHDMVYYSGREDKALQVKGWAELLRDAVAAAVTDGGIDLSSYQCVMVFHAGVGQDFAFDLDATPYDIQSVYLDFAALQQGLAPGIADFQGIALPDGHFLREGIILPETQNQEGIDLGLLGTMTLLTGSWLGMPSLFDTRSGRAGIGRWGLMDQGSANFQGFIPAEPSAWEKIYMGWDSAIEVRNGEELRIGSSTTVTAPHILKIPINEQEYYLVENRQRDPNHDRLAIGRDESGNRAEFDSTGRVVAPAGIGVLTRIDDYDYGLPGSGVLIWHIDENVIARGLADNTVNGDREHRGVDLVECDGAQDIGYVYSLFDAAYGTENGDYYDAWWRSNESHLQLNKSSEVAFSPTSIPDSRAYDGGNTHISLTHFSEPDTVMTLTIRSDFAQPGFPESTSAGFAPGALLAVEPAVGRPGWLLSVALDGTVLGYTSNGSPLFANGAVMVAAASDSVFLPPAIADIDGDGVQELLVATKSGCLNGWKLQDGPVVDGRLDQLFNSCEGSAASAGPMILQTAGRSTPLMVVGYQSGGCRIYGRTGETFDCDQTLLLGASAVCGLAASPAGSFDFVAACRDGYLYACRAVPGSVVWKRKLAFDEDSQPVVADFNADGSLEIMAVSARGGLQWFNQQGEDLGVYHPATALTQTAAPSLGDIDADGCPEILINSATGFYVFEGSGAIGLNFPKAYDVSALSTVPAAVWRCDGDLSNNLAVCAEAGPALHAFDRRGLEGDDFPLTTGSGLAATPVLADLDGDGRVEMAGISQEGVLYVWKTGWRSSGQLAWSMQGGDPGRRFLWKAAVEPAVEQADWLPAKKVFCYPNPAVDGRTTIRFTLGRNAEEVDISIYDLAGNFVDRMRLQHLAAGDHESIWSVQSVASGVYLARVEARSGGERRVEFIKIAVTQ